MQSKPRLCRPGAGARAEETGGEGKEAAGWGFFLEEASLPPARHPYPRLLLLPPPLPAPGFPLLAVPTDRLGSSPSPPLGLGVCLFQFLSSRTLFLPVPACPRFLHDLAWCSLGSLPQGHCHHQAQRMHRARSSVPQTASLRGGRGPGFPSLPSHSVPCSLDKANRAHPCS